MSGANPHASASPGQSLQSEPEEEFSVMGDPEDREGFDVMGTADWRKSFDYRLPLEALDLETLAVAPPAEPRASLPLPHSEQRFWVEVAAFRKRSDSFLNSHHEFLLRGELPCSALRSFEVWRRFSQFEEFLEYLKNIHPYSMFPHLPPKPLMSSATLIEKTDFLEDRRRTLDLLMKKLLTHQNLLGAFPEPRLLEFLNSQNEFTLVTRSSRMKTALIGSAQVRLAKTKNYLSSFFTRPSADDDLRYEYGGQEEDDLKQTQRDLAAIQASAAAVLARLKGLLADSAKKSDALKALYQTGCEMIQNKSTVEKLGLNSNYLFSQAESFLATLQQVNKLATLLRDYFSFHILDLQLDVEEALERIQSRLDKADQIRAGSLNTKDKSEIRLIWEQHTYIVQQMGLEMKLFKTQASESMRRLMRELEQSLLHHHSVVTSKWEEAVSNKTVFGSQDEDDMQADKADYR